MAAPTQAAGGEAVAVIGRDFHLLYAGRDAVSDIVKRHGLKVGSYLYAAAPAAAVEPRTTPPCRDCADFGPICPSSGQPCDKRAAAAPEGLTGLIAELWAMAQSKEPINDVCDRMERHLKAAIATPDTKASPEGLTAHPDDEAVDRFAAAMKEKLAAARAKGRSGWDDPEQCTTIYLSELLFDHVDKGDPVDVANFAMMLHQRGSRIESEAAIEVWRTPATPDAKTAEERKP